MVFGCVWSLFGLGGFVMDGCWSGLVFSALLRFLWGGMVCFVWCAVGGLCQLIDWQVGLFASVWFGCGWFGEFGVG